MDFNRISPLHLAGFAFVVALIFSLLIYPQLGSPLESTLSADGHDRLGFGIYHYGTLSFYPSTEPTVMRGPIYPLLVAGSLLFGKSLYPYPLIILQALLHALTTLLTYRIVKELSGTSRHALLAGFIVAAHPFLLWYIGRVVVEPLTISLFTLLALRLLSYNDKPNFQQGLLLGIVLGIAALAKGIFLVFVIALPILLALTGRQERKMNGETSNTSMKRGFASSKTLLLVPLTSLCLILPWTLRNSQLTNSLVPVHILDGVNFAVGDHLSERFTSSPLAYAPIINTFVYPEHPGGANELMELEANETVRYDRSLRAHSDNTLEERTMIGRNATSPL